MSLVFVIRNRDVWVRSWETKLESKLFEVIEETDEESYFDDLENSEREIFDGDDDADMKGLRQEVSKQIDM